MSEQAIMKTNDEDTITSALRRFPNWSNDSLKLYIHELEKKHEADLLPLLQLQTAVEKIEKYFISLDGSDDEFWEEVSFGNACEDDNDNKQFYMITKDNKRVIHAGSIHQALINLAEKL